jgi:hypothetical protein
MPILVGRWERRDNADRNALGRAALDVCRANRAADGVRGSRFFWASTDHIVTMTEAESAQVFDQPATADQARAAFALSDLARPVSTERWADPRAGEDTFHRAGR